MAGAGVTLKRYLHEEDVWVVGRKDRYHHWLNWRPDGERAVADFDLYDLGLTLRFYSPDAVLGLACALMELARQLSIYQADVLREANRRAREGPF